MWRLENVHKVLGGIAATAVLLAFQPDVAAATRVTGAFSVRRGLSGGVSARLASRSGRHGYSHRHYGFRSYSYRPRYYGSSFYLSFGPVYRYYSYRPWSYGYSYRPWSYGYGYYQPYYYPYGYRPWYGYSYSARVHRPYFRSRGSYGSYSYHLPYDYGGYCCPPVVCCNPCDPGPRCVQEPPPRGVRESEKVAPVPGSSEPPVPRKLPEKGKQQGPSF